MEEDRGHCPPISEPMYQLVLRQVPPGSKKPSCKAEDTMGGENSRASAVTEAAVQCRDARHPEQQGRHEAAGG